MGTQLPETCREIETNILRSSAHLVGFIWKRLYRNVGQQNTEYTIMFDTTFLQYQQHGYASALKRSWVELSLKYFWRSMVDDMQDASLHPDSSLLRTSSGDVAVVKLKTRGRHRPSGFIRATNLPTSQTTVSFAHTTLLIWNTWTATIRSDSIFSGLEGSPDHGIQQ